MSRRTKRLSWALWALCSLAAGAALADRLLGEPRSRSLFLPGKTSDGHYQIELECEACHKSEFSSAEDLQAACVECHGPELAEAKDSHPTSKFTDPRNAERVAILDGRYCVTCHAEHRPERTGSMGLSLPVDYCYHCHEDVGTERASHAGLPFDGCASAGCHNFHDNRALYEDYLLQHGTQPRLLGQPTVGSFANAHGEAAGGSLALDEAGNEAARAEGDAAPTREGARALELADADAVDPSGRHAEAWSESAHARAGINCSGCHTAPGGGFQREVSVDLCGSCHQGETNGWLAGRHGMRVKVGLGPMRVADARLPMTEAAQGRELACSSCHGDHGTELEQAGLEACESCHADLHTRSYRSSQHFSLLLAERSGEGAPGTGVSCATCHLPAYTDESGRRSRAHNQNDNLRPVEKMIRTVCQDCHGLAFSIDALADPELVRSNFKGSPNKHVPSIDFARRRAE